MAISQFDERSILSGIATFAPAYSPGTPSLVINSARADFRVDVLVLTNNDTASVLATIWLQPAGSSIQIAQINVPAGAGSGTTPPVDVLDYLFGSTYHYLLLLANTQVQVSFGTAPGSGKQFAAYASGGAF